MKIFKHILSFFSLIASICVSGISLFNIILTNAWAGWSIQGAKDIFIVLSIFFAPLVVIIYSKFLRTKEDKYFHYLIIALLLSVLCFYFFSK